MPPCLRTQAVNLVADMSERIRANPDEDHLAEWLESVRAVLPSSSGDVSHSAEDGLDQLSRDRLLARAG